MLKLLFDAGYVTIVVVGTLKSAFSFFISAVVHELRLVQELTRTLNPAVALGTKISIEAFSNSEY